MNPNPADSQLVNKALSGDTQAFGAIIKNTEKLVAQIVCKMIPNVEDRKDLAQDIYLKVYKQLPGFRYQAKLSTWIAQISYNTCMDHLRKKKLLLPGEIVPEGSEVFVFSKDVSSILNTAIDQLSPVYKTLITLYHQEELSYEEIGQITGLPDGTVKNYLFRARKALREYLTFHYKKEDL
ncbi:sigma-70 family RNA polymerase sigma factor [Chitinophaga sp. SYP-B3965]|uniref:RNA polymerase sigma factor n=1 Tax=Chitinophaga sp. SYP-B3965 TaxID=2663120 RepID=UPI001299BDEE|nr:sigma-70 family RNA polymerase sigma factor [Chitinophaga sp. SYP-B3965]MRG48584.1 sigma-70 family RNA polymerase sigma factor [Chitinophaga sp. SYP-B3965]